VVRFLALGLALGMLLAALPASGRLVGTEFRVTDTYGVEEQPHLYQDRVVWADKSQGETEDIWMYDFATGRRTQLSSAIGDEWWPHIYGDTVVWGHTVLVEDSTGTIVAVPTFAIHSISSGTTRLAKQVATAGTFPAELQKHPVIYGEWVVWENQNVDVFDIYAMNVATGLVTPITNDPAVQHLPYISKNWVAYEQVAGTCPGVGCNTDLWVYYLQFPYFKAKVANATDWDEMDPTIFNNTLVYTDYRNDSDRRCSVCNALTSEDDADLYRVDLTALIDGQPLAAPEPLVTLPGSQEEPRLYNDRLVWRNFLPGNATADLWTMDLQERQPEELIGGPADLWEVQIWEDRIVWSDLRADTNINDQIDDFDVWAFCLGDAPCGFVPQENSVFPAVVGGLLIVTAGAAVVAYMARRASHREEERRAAEEASRRKRSKGKGPRSAPRS